MHQKNIEMNYLMALLNTSVTSIAHAINVARHDKDETEGDFSTFENQKDIFFRRIREALTAGKAIEKLLADHRCKDCLHQFGKNGMGIRYNDDPNHDPDPYSPHHYRPRPCRLGECNGFHK